MILLISGFVILALAMHHWQRTAKPKNSIRIPGVVIDVLHRETTIGGTVSVLYGPVVRYTNPTTHQPATLEPTGHSQVKYDIGDRVEVDCSLTDNQAVLVLSHPLIQRATPIVFALVIIGLGIVDLTNIL